MGEILLLHSSLSSFFVGGDSFSPPIFFLPLTDYSRYTEGTVAKTNLPGRQDGDTPGLRDFE